MKTNGTIYRRPDRAGFYANFVDPVTGKRRRVLLAESSSEEQARARLGEILKERTELVEKLSGIDGDPDVTLEDYAREWLEAVRHELEAKTIRSYERNLEDHVLPALGRKLLREVTRGDVNRLLRDKQTRGYKRKEQHHAYRQHSLRLMRSARKSFTRSTPRTLTSSGARCASNELGTPSPGGSRGTKTNRPRDVELSSICLRLLDQYLPWLHEEALRYGWGRPNWLFPNEENKPLDESKVRKEFHRLLKAAGIRSRAFYQLRHTFASLALSERAPLLWVSEQLGHDKPSTTLRYYSKYMPSERHGYADLVDGLTGAEPATENVTTTSPELSPAKVSLQVVEDVGAGERI